MKMADIPRRIVSYEYCTHHTWYPKIEMYNILGKDGWHPIEEVDCHNHYHSGGVRCTETKLDGVLVTFTGQHRITIFEREVHEFRTHS